MGRTLLSLLMALGLTLAGVPAFGQPNGQPPPRSRDNRAVRSQTLHLPGMTIERYQIDGGEIKTRSYHYSPNSGQYNRGQVRGRPGHPRYYGGYPGYGPGSGGNHDRRYR